MRLQGVFTALVTPFREGEVDLDRFRSLCRRQLDAGVHGLVPCGTTGETPTLTHEEWASLVGAAVEVSGGRAPVIAGCGSNATAATAANIREAKELGADAALVVFPYYNKPSPQGLESHVREACAQGLPVVLYHVPGRTGQRIGAALLERLCRIPGVVGLKEATGDVTLGQELLNRLEGAGVSLLSGDDFTYAALAAMGFDGVISVVSNPAPAMAVEWLEAAHTGDVQRLRAMRRKLLPVVSALFSASNPIPCKAAMHRMGLLENELRLPLAAQGDLDLSSIEGLR
jgi:4-hydroxy-tetrahydrodipicolinate synthase